MNIIILPLVAAAVLISILGVYNLSIDSGYSAAQNSMDSISYLAERKNEILDAKIVESVIMLESHSQKDTEVFLIDFMLRCDDADTCNKVKVCIKHFRCILPSQKTYSIPLFSRSQST